MSSTSSQESAASPSDLNERECEPSPSVRSSPTLAPSSPSIGPTSHATTTCEVLPLTGSAQMELLPMSSVAASPARTSASLAPEQDLLASVPAYGSSTPELLANYDPASLSWRTSQRCLVEGWTAFSETWPRSGMMQSGIAYRLPPLAPLTDATASGLLPTPEASNTKAQAMRSAGRPPRDFLKLWPTPRANDSQKRGNFANNPRNGLPAAVKYWPTPVARMWKDNASPAEFKRNEVPLAAQVGGALNPTWVEWLMGFPLGWTALKDWETPSSRKSRKSSGEQS